MVTGYKMIDHKCNEGIRKELVITDINKIIRNYQING
jgi:hypothetical protein